MGMTNNQYKGYVRLVLASVKEVKVRTEKCVDDENRKDALEKIEDLIKDLQAALED